jgi:hypothetical protein
MWEGNTTIELVDLGAIELGFLDNLFATSL